MKIVSSINQIRILPDNTGTAYGSAEVSYGVASQDDSTLSRGGTMLIDLSGFSGTMTDLYAAVVAAVKEQEGIA